jgi:hypothetical protein
MNPLEEFEASFNENYGLLSQLFSAVGHSPPPVVSDVLGLTVEGYLAVLDGYQEGLLAITPEDLDNITPFVLQSYSAEAQAYVEALRAQDYPAVIAPLDGGRSFVASATPGQSMRDFIIASNPDYDFTTIPEVPPVLPPVVIPDDNRDTTEAEVGQVIAAFRTELSALLWSEEAGNFVSPTFRIDTATGDWITIDTSGGNVRGTSLNQFYTQLGDAAARSIISFLGAQENVVQAILAQMGTAEDFEDATNAAEGAARLALQGLQMLGSNVATGAEHSPAEAASQAAAYVQALMDALARELPGLGDALDDLTLGSRNSDPSFVVSPEGTAVGSEHGDWFYLSTNDDVFDAAAGEDVLFGLGGDDALNGGSDADQLYGGDGADSLAGGSGNDMLMGGAGNDVIAGGAGGDDVASFEGPMGRYTLQLSSDGTLTVQDRMTNGDGTDTVSGIETLAFETGNADFANGVLDLGIIQGITGLSETDVSTFIELYIAYFNRAPDALGLYFWGSAIANGTSLEQTAALFLDQDETRATYPEADSNLAFATQVYSNVLGRVPDQAGLDFWEGQLNSGNVSRGGFILEVLRGAKADPASNAAQEFIDLQIMDRAYLANKTDIGTYFAVTKGLSDVAEASAAMQLYQRDDENSIQSAIAEIDADYAQAVSAESGVLILQLVGVVDDPFAF